MSNFKWIDVQHLNDECQIDLSVKSFDISPSNDKCENNLNVKLLVFQHPNEKCLMILMSTI